MQKSLTRDMAPKPVSRSVQERMTIEAVSLKPMRHKNARPTAVSEVALGNSKDKATRHREAPAVVNSNTSVNQRWQQNRKYSGR